MSIRAAGQYAVIGALIAVTTAGLLLAATWSYGKAFVLWTLAGWFLMALMGIVGGAWATVEHGRPTAGFIVAVGTCMLTRLIVAAAGALAAVAVGGQAVWAYAAGLGAGYVPLQVCETIWFMRRSGRSDP